MREEKNWYLEDESIENEANAGEEDGEESEDGEIVVGGVRFVVPVEGPQLLLNRIHHHRRFASLAGVRNFLGKQTENRDGLVSCRFYNNASPQKLDVNDPLIDSPLLVISFFFFSFLLTFGYISFALFLVFRF